MIINHFFYFSSSFAAQLSLFDIRNIKRGNWERQIARNGKLNIGYTKVYNHLQAATTIHNHPQPSTTTHNHLQPPTTIHNHPKITKKS